MIVVVSDTSVITALLTIGQGLSALRKAGKSGYKPLAAAKK